MWAWQRMQAGKMGNGQPRVGCTKGKSQTGVELIDKVQGATKNAREKPGNG